MTTIDKIRSATRPMHETLDTAIMPAIKSIRTPDDYVRLLAAFYGFFQPVYEKIDAHLRRSDLPDYATRRKPADIVKNITTLGYGEPLANRCQLIPHIHNNASAFGALYVMEGSTLGGLMIKKMIAEQTGLADEQLSFFAGYGRQTRERWHTFTEALNHTTGTEAEEQTTLATAAETFACFKDWLDIIYF